MRHRFWSRPRRNRRQERSRQKILSIETLETRQLLAADPLITEIMSDNDGTLIDLDGNPSDWIEIYNAGDEAVELEGWYLTDDADELGKWRFPSVDLEAGDYLVLFASGQESDNYVDEGGSLHTNFRLSSDGEYLALVRPDMTKASEFAPEYPQQRQDVSFGTSMETTTTLLVEPGAAARTLIPTAEEDEDWTGGNEPFDDSTWTHGNGTSTGVGYSVAVEGTPGLVAEWTFESSDGAAVTDRQSAVGTIDETAGADGGPYPGVALGDAPVVAGGLVYASDAPVNIASTYSLVFPAPENAANHVRIPMDAGDPLANITVGDFRVEAWFRTTDRGRNVLTGSYVGAATSLNLELHTNNRGRIYVQGPTSVTDLNVTLPTNSRDGNWHHLAGVREEGTVKLFYDGVQVGTAPDTAGDFTINKPAFFIGRDNRSGSTVFNGSIDNVRFYDSADTSRLVAAYDFETVNGIPVTDGQDVAGQVDDTGGDLAGPYDGSGFSTAGGGLEGINYTTDVAAVLSDSTYALEIDEANSNAESFNVGMPPAIANLTQGDFSLQAWFKTTDTGRSILMGSYTGPDNALNFELHTGNRIRVWIQNAAGSTTDLNVPVSAVGNSRDGQWHFGTAVRRGTTVELYYDGVLVGSTSDVAGSFAQTARSYYFGRDSRTADTRFDGSLDNIRFWDVALTSEQIRDMAAGATPEEVTGGAFDKLIGTNIETEMRDINTSAYIRIPFHVADSQAYNSLKLRMKYDDGFVAYINGHEVARRNAPLQSDWNSSAVSDRTIDEAKTYEEIDLGTPSELLHTGVNLLAIQGLNFGSADTDFLVLPELLGVTTTVDKDGPRYFTSPTPGGPNEGGVLGFVSDTTFSVDRGFYDAHDLAPGGVLENGIAIATDTPGATIRYTIDGSWPTADHGTVYTEPIAIATTTTLRAAAFLDGYQPTNADTHTYIFLDDVIRQPRNPGHDDPDDPQYPLPFPLTHQSGVAADYEMDPQVVEDPLYADTIRGDLKSIPTVSLVMDMDDVFNQPNGIWSNSQQRGLNWERLTSVEYFDPSDPDREFQVNSAIRIQGRASRVPSSSIKHAFRLIFKDDYGPEGDEKPTGGPTKLEFPLFEDSPVDRFDTIVLRGGYNYSYLHGSNDQNIRAQYIRDNFMRESQLAMGQLSARGSYVHLYVNGLYFGLYSPQERPDASFMAQHLGGDKEEYDVISAGEVKDGDAEAWNELLTRAALDLSVSENYQAVLELLDVESLIDYMIVHIWGGTTDWPAPGGQLRNWVVGRKREEGEAFKFYVWDAEYSIQGVNDNRVNVGDPNTPAFIYRRMRDNPEFRMLFADHLHKHFHHDGALTPEQNIARYSRLADTIDRAIVGESARWGDTRGDACNPCLHDPLWVNERDWVLDTYMPGRTDTVLDQFRRADLYPPTAAPEFGQHGGRVPGGFELSISSLDSDVFFDTTLIELGSAAKVLVPTDDRLGTSWTERTFFPGEDWIDGSTGVGFDRGAGYETAINTDIESQMFGEQSSAYLRIEFPYDGTQRFDRLQLRMKFDDGFVAYINGTEVARSSNIPLGTPAHNATAGSHEATEFEPFDIDLSGRDGNLLVTGANVLAIHGMNRNKTNSDLLMLPELIGRVLDNTPAPKPIWYTVDGSDPRLPGGNISPAAVQYVRPFPLTSTSLVRARSLVNDEWSALNEALFVAETPLRITEINYNPSAPTSAEEAAIPGIDNDDFEFIELQNTGSRALNLAGVTLDGGVSFAFPYVTLAAGEYAVVVEDIQAFQQRYGTSVKVLGQWTGRLANDGEQLILADGLNETILDFEYDDSDPWPEQADGAGATLELIDSAETPVDQFGEYYRWRGSTVSGGTPGSFFAPPPGDANLDGVFNRLDIVRVLQAGKYLTGQPATFEEGDWNGDGEFEQLDIMTVLVAGNYRDD